MFCATSTYMTLAQLLFAAILLIFPNTPSRACLMAHQANIEADITRSSATYSVPAGLLVSVAFNETHLGCDRGSGGCWGAPIDAQHRHTAGNSDSAARVLRTGYDRCHNSWRGAVSRFRCGLCACPEQYAGYVNHVLSLSRRLYTQAGRAVPVELQGE